MTFKVKVDPPETFLLPMPGFLLGNPSMNPLFRSKKSMSKKMRKEELWRYLCLTYNPLIICRKLIKDLSVWTRLKINPRLWRDLSLPKFKLRKITHQLKNLPQIIKILKKRNLKRICYFKKVWKKLSRDPRVKRSFSMNPNYSPEKLSEILKKRKIKNGINWLWLKEENWTADYKFKKLIKNLLNYISTFLQ